MSVLRSVNTVIAVSFSPVGAVIAPRLPPWNPIGWLFCVIRLLVAEYAIATLLAEPGSRLGELSSGKALAWVSSWVWVVHFGPFIFLVLLFPDSRLPSLRCRHLTSSPQRVDTQMTTRVQ
jgi:hypothetical protein